MEVLAIPAGERVRQGVTERRKNLRRTTGSGNLKRRQIRGEHSDNRIRRVVQMNHAVQNARVTAELSHPQGIAQDQLEAVAGLVFLRKEAAADFHGNAERVKKVEIDSHAAENLRFPALHIGATDRKSTRLNSSH